MSVDELLKAANQLSELDLDQLTQKVLLLRAKRQAPILSHLETELYLKINQGLPADLHQEYRALVNKRDDVELTETEYARLLELSDRIEALTVDRTQAIIQLANLRGIPFMQLMDELDIHAPENDDWAHSRVALPLN
jgi:hypothetical protein